MNIDAYHTSQLDLNPPRGDLGYFRDRTGSAASPATTSERQSEYADWQPANKPPSDILKAASTSNAKPSGDALLALTASLDAAKPRPGRQVMPGGLRRNRP